MSQNTSTAVMQQRSEAHDSLDDFPTPPWATRALIEHVILPQLGLVGRLRIKGMSVWEPAVNRGYMFAPLKEYFGRVYGTDIHPYDGLGHEQHDFLLPFLPTSVVAPEWVITNPPFRLAEQFIARAQQLPKWRGTAMLVRTSFLEGGDRFENLFSINPPSIVAQFAERVIMHKGILRDPNKEYLDPRTGEMKRPSTATSYCWLVWMEETRVDTRMMWIPPCRRKLERPGDYPIVSCETNSVPHRVPEITPNANERATSGA